MKIDKTQSGSDVQSKKRAKSGNASGSTDFSGLINDAGETAEGAAAHQAGALAQMDALLSVQNVDPVEQERQSRGRAINRAGRLLDILEEIRMGLLNGTLSERHLLDIENMVAQNRDKITDPQLTQLLDEIDLRAQIELAKLEKAKSNAQRMSDG